ncbi:NADAR family protein [Deinococcus ruber]|uniref:NADAR domain-containing protein n=1 Tax=Deinococcus ruber TaxID=1848197 RepID=A0A918F7A2_9DEIO|nr:NADAR family protein [Deinococcus ruber]GGR15732.1 hypothetical protein GCM10008957_30590 [Deinococcus ruber]
MWPAPPGPVTRMEITRFDGEFRWLSNFFPAPIRMSGLIFPCVENAYQAAKTLDHAARLPFVTLTPGAAKRAGRTLVLRPDWDSLRFEILLAMLRRKFRAGSLLADQVLATGTCQLIEGNTWGDRVYGVDLRTGIGENHLLIPA